ncbi:crossover junction endodeoxyribonuclease RuvC [Rickettsiales endosymbiont of Peranema trichophorum]|uniref:crossover junction endodeoxyribonuclease RuvC n=1 Tax=Rickettsiales endosymbiont of Peranema trichophorum TaxID=2486577 RepID=UPI0010238655|nr:crossover junction endodeoxyribonuclease RuvC [Rickettsiales endosymbiont of Peranema trichophorum]RZI45617.1 crossover junction endodeoxyribonuclease RuvC [Rickettsiales endosymbiont of Peranema trichophorum]
MTRIIGVDPGLSRTGWAVIECHGSHVSYLGADTILTSSKDPIGLRFSTIFREINSVIQTYMPEHSAIEDTYVNANFESSLKLSQARAIAILALELKQLGPVSYPARKVKKTLLGYGGADKEQMLKMVGMILPAANVKSPDAADALAIALCHFYLGLNQRLFE